MATRLANLCYIMPMKTKPLLSITIFILCVSVLIAACEDDCDYQEGLGYTEDVGLECNINGCTADWCRDDQQVDCRSGFCIGPWNGYYCSVPCSLDVDCPVGYICAEECNSHVAQTPVCVKEKDWALLQELGYCP